LQLLVALAETWYQSKNFEFRRKRDLVLGKAIKEGRTGEIINTDEFLKSLK
jgi:hypothetical protein